MEPFYVAGYLKLDNGRCIVGQSNGLLDLLYSGLGNLAAYLAAHVLLCLLPAWYSTGNFAAMDTI